MSGKVAILIDGGFFQYMAKKLIGNPPNNENIMQFAHACARPEEQIFRIFYYNAYPYPGKLRNPLSQAGAGSGKETFVAERTKQFDALAQENLIAFRRGTIQFNGWKIREKTAADLIAGKRTSPLTDSDVVADFKQKAVDIKIGLDVAWLSSRRLVEKMILVTGDTDFVPAMKHARREGVQVVVVEFPGQRLSPSLREHSDEHREVSFDAAKGKFHLI